MEYRIVDAAERHLEKLTELEKRCFSEPWTRETLRGQFKDGFHEFLVAEEANGELLGYGAMTYVLDEGSVSNVAVSPEYRRRGIGDCLIEALLEKAVTLELAFVTLEVRESNLAARELYKKHGFKDVGRRKNYYDLPREDAILMTLFLKEE